MWILPFLTAGLFDRGRPRASGATSIRDERREDVEAATRRLLQSLCDSDGIPEADQGASTDGDEQEGGKRGTASPSFDWDAYNNAFPGTPLHAAVTAMFAEYALLVGRVTRRLGAATVTPMTLSEGAAIQEQAQTFLLRYVTPILGALATTKTHRLLCHVLHAVRYHGNVLNANTSANESRPKADKKQYQRTNKRKGYTRQLVRRAQGTRAILRRNEALSNQLKDQVAGLHDGDAEYEADAESADTRSLKRRALNVQQEVVGRVACAPGLAGLDRLLGIGAHVAVGMPSYLYIKAQLPCGAIRRQIVRTSSCFHGRPWYDHVAYRLPGAPLSAPAHYGQARCLLRLPGGVDVVVVAEMERASRSDECPLSARGCTQLRWRMRSDAGTATAHLCVRLRVVQLADVLRVVHIVPDMALLCRLKGLGSRPPSFGTTGESVRDMQYLLNAFIPDM